MIRLARHKGVGFVLLIRDFEISYSHYDPHDFISWTRSITVGKRRWWYRENWSIVASTPPFRYRGGKI